MRPENHRSMKLAGNGANAASIASTTAPSSSTRIASLIIRYRWAAILPRSVSAGGFALVNGQIQYGSARLLTSRATPLRRRGSRLADPRRFKAEVRQTMMLPNRCESAGAELAGCGQFRHEVNSIGDQPTRAHLESLLTRPRELGLRDEEIAHGAVADKGIARRIGPCSPDCAGRAPRRRQRRAARARGRLSFRHARAVRPPASRPVRASVVDDAAGSSSAAPST